MDKRLSRFITDPEKIERMISQYELAAKKNKEAADAYFKGKSMADALAEWEAKIEDAKKELLAVKEDAKHLDITSKELLGKARAKLSDVEAREKALDEKDKTIADREKSFEKEKQIYEELLEGLMQDKIKLESKKTDLNSWLNSINGLIKSFPS